MLSSTQVLYCNLCWVSSGLVLKKIAAIGLAVVCIGAWMALFTFSRTWDTSHLYRAPNFDFSVDDASRIGWADLLPDADKNVLLRTQSQPRGSLEDQMFAAINKASDSAYQQMSISMETVDALRNKIVQIPGFIVPLEYNKAKRATAFFVVPYYGACLHYPAPAPNQMLYVFARQGIDVPDLEQAYLFSGLLTPDPYEDLMGTAAYHLVLYQMNEFKAEPDDLRQH